MLHLKISGTKRGVKVPILTGDKLGFRLVIFLWVLKTVPIPKTREIGSLVFIYVDLIP